MSRATATFRSLNGPVGEKLHILSTLLRKRTLCREKVLEGIGRGAFLLFSRWLFVVSVPTDLLLCEIVVLY